MNKMFRIVFHLCQTSWYKLWKKKMLFIYVGKFLIVLVGVVLWKKPAPMGVSSCLKGFYCTYLRDMFCIVSMGSNSVCIRAYITNRTVLEDDPLHSIKNKKKDIIHDDLYIRCFRTCR